LSDLSPLHLAMTAATNLRQRCHLLFSLSLEVETVSNQC
jgi:hypothetical protein